MTAETPTAPIKSAANSGNSNTGCGGRGLGGRGGGRGNQGCRNQQGRGGHAGRVKSQPPKNSIPVLKGMCTKDLHKKVVIHSDNWTVMAAQWIRFDQHVYNAARKLDPKVAQALAARKAKTLGDFLPPPQDPMEYTIKINVVGGKKVPQYNLAKKKLYEKAKN